jgi:type III secretory pathway component EscS
MERKNFIAIIVVFVVLGVIRSIGIENIPFPVVVMVVILGLGTALVIALKYKGNKKERIYLLIMTILMIMLASVVMLAVVIQNDYPQLSEKVKPIFIGLMAILFVMFLITVYANLIYKFRNK